MKNRRLQELQCQACPLGPLVWNRVSEESLTKFFFFEMVVIVSSLNIDG